MCVDISAPTNVRATVLTPDRIKVEWDQSSAVIGYVISYRTASNACSGKVVVNGGCTATCDLTNVKQNTQYIITVQAKSIDNRMSVIDESNEVSVTTYADGKNLILQSRTEI